MYLSLYNEAGLRENNKCADLEFCYTKSKPNKKGGYYEKIDFASHRYQPMACFGE